MENKVKCEFVDTSCGRSRNTPQRPAQLAPQSATFEIGGPREIGTSSKKIETAADLAGMKFRASRSPLEIASHEAWGAAGVTVDWPETPEALRLGMVDGLTVPYASFYSA